jgi:pimeloyl-ACP methyl ester carboxylesterase
MTTLILLPGMACDAALWRHQQPALAAAAPGAVVVADVHGRADSLPAMAALLLAEQPGDLLLAGASLGGMLAMEAARQAPGNGCAAWRCWAPPPGPTRPSW